MDDVRRQLPERFANGGRQLRRPVGFGQEAAMVGNIGVLKRCVT